MGISGNFQSQFLAFPRLLVSGAHEERLRERSERREKRA